jgi:hypothetical protein
MNRIISMHKKRIHTSDLPDQCCCFSSGSQYKKIAHTSDLPSSTKCSQSSTVSCCCFVLFGWQEYNQMHFSYLPVRITNSQKATHHSCCCCCCCCCCFIMFCWQEYNQHAPEEDASVVVYLSIHSFSCMQKFTMQSVYLQKFTQFGCATNSSTAQHAAQLLLLLLFHIDWLTCTGIYTHPACACNAPPEEDAHQ